MTPERIHFSRRGFLKGVLGAVGAGVLIGAGVKGAAPETARPTPTGIPDRPLTVPLTPKARIAETAASPEQETGVDFANVHLVTTGSLDKPGNQLVGLARTDDENTHVAVMDLDKTDLSSDRLLMNEVYQVPFIAQAVAVDPKDPNKIMVVGFVRVDYSGHTVGMLAATSDGKNFTTVKGNHELMYSVQLIDGLGFVVERSPWGVMIAKYSFTDRKIVDDIEVTGTAGRGSVLAPLVPSQPGYMGYLSSRAYFGYATLNINGGASGQYVNTDQGTPHQLLFWPEGTDKMVGVMNNDTTAPGDERQELPTVYINKNDSLQYKFQPDLADFYSSLLPGGLVMSTFTYNLTDRNFYTVVVVEPAFQDNAQFFIEVIPQDDPNNPAKRKLMIPTINGQQITSLPTSYGINSIYNSYINGEHYLLLGGDFGGAIAKVPPLTERISTLEFKPIKLLFPSPSRIFLPLTMGQ